MCQTCRLWYVWGLLEACRVVHWHEAVHLKGAEREELSPRLTRRHPDIKSQGKAEMALLVSWL